MSVSIRDHLSSDDPHPKKSLDLSFQHPTLGRLQSPAVVLWQAWRHEQRRLSKLEALSSEISASYHLFALPTLAVSNGRPAMRPSHSPAAFSSVGRYADSGPNGCTALMSTTAPEDAFVGVNPLCPFSALERDSVPFISAGPLELNTRDRRDGSPHPIIALATPQRVCVCTAGI